MTSTTSTEPEVGTANVGETITSLQFMQDAEPGTWVLYVGTLVRNRPRVYEKLGDDTWQYVGVTVDPTPTSGFMSAVQSGRMHRYVPVPEQEWSIGQRITDMRQLQRLPIGARIQHTGRRETSWEIVLHDGQLSGQRLHEPGSTPVRLSNFHLDAVEVIHLPGEESEFTLGQHITDDEAVLRALPHGTRFRNSSDMEWEVGTANNQWRAYQIVNGEPDVRNDRRADSFTADDGFTITRLGSVSTEPDPTEEIERLRTEMHEQAERHHREVEEFKRKVQRVAMRFAEDNDLCGEVERCLDEMGLEAPRRTWEFEVVHRFRVRADITTTGSDRVPDEDFIIRSMSATGDPVTLDSDWENVEFPGRYDDDRFEVVAIERAEEE